MFSRDWSSDVCSSALLVDGVVDDLPQQVVVAVRIGAADVHGRSLADRLAPLEDLDVFRGVAGSHVSSPPAAGWWAVAVRPWRSRDRKSTRLNSSHVKN